MQPGVVGVIDDDAVYAVTARSIAEGHGYRLINLPGAPLQTKYPVLYPAIISAAWRTGAAIETNLFAMQATTTAIAALALALAWLFIVRFGVGARAPAFAACLLVTSAPNYLFYCSETVSEMPFLALMIAALWAAETRLRRPDDKASMLRDVAHRSSSRSSVSLPHGRRGAAGSGGDRVRSATASRARRQAISFSARSS